MIIDATKPAVKKAYEKNDSAEDISSPEHKVKGGKDFNKKDDSSRRPDSSKMDYKSDRNSGTNSSQSKKN